MKEKLQTIPINQEEIYSYLRDIRKIRVMTPEREKELAEKMKREDVTSLDREIIEKELGVLKG